MSTTQSRSDVRALRERLGWTQERLASELGCSLASVNRWERGVRAPSPLAARELARLLARAEAGDSGHPRTGEGEVA